MKNYRQSFSGILPAFIILMFFISPVRAIAQENSLKLTYSYPADTPVKYVTIGKIVQDMNVEGQSIVVNVQSILGATVKSTGAADNNLKLVVTIDTIAQTIETPGGINGGAIKEVTGSFFTMTLSPQGVETDMSAAENLKITAPDGTVTTAAQSFQEFFPDVPEEAIAPGHKWTGTDTIYSKTSAVSIVMIVKAENKFEGFELLNDINCAKITFTLSGTRLMKTRTQDMDLNISGPFTGTGVLYFSPEKGYFLKQEISTTMKGQIEVVEQNVSFPVTLTMNSTTELKP